MKIPLLGCLPIPVGHRVVVRWYHKKSKGLFGGAKDETHPSQPSVEDLDTGVLYAFEWIYGAGATHVEDTVNEYALPSAFPDRLDEGIEEQRVVVGRVTACRVIACIGHGHNQGTVDPQTELTIVLEENAQPPYR